MPLLTIVLILTSICVPTFALNILVWSSTIGQSHINFIGNVADTLREDGHNVTLLIVEFDPDFKTSSGTRLVEHVIRYSSPYHNSADWRTLTFKQGVVFNSIFGLNFIDLIKMQIYAYRVCKGMLENPVLIDLLRHSKFDLGIFEMFHSCPAGLMELAGKAQLERNFAASLTMCGGRMSFLERLYNVFINGSGFILANIFEYFEQSLFESKFPGFKNLHNLIKDKTDYMLMNTNEFTESTRPTLRSIQYVGGSATRDPQPLDEEFEWIVSRGSKGAILFSLGSLVKPSDMPVAVRKAFMDAFRTFTDYVILWKDDTQLNSSYPNIYFRDWVPQVDLLGAECSRFLTFFTIFSGCLLNTVDYFAADGRVKLFITHGGMNSMQESLLFGVPMITVPLFADQDSNAAVAAERGFSVNLSKFAVTKEKVIDAINKVLGKDGKESTYTQKVRQAARLLKGSPEEMRHTIKRLARISGTEPPLKHLKLDIDHLNNIQYYNIDIYLLLLSVVLVHLWISASLSIRMTKFFTALKKKTD
ncbi:UDP-glucoronosyl and UDP-glucosyl transferase [Ancylostoma caninum]|uniref:glucuronosyltransferase n=1 Tax=Ancylostoma caninum TaxID=29170 RepID=A0A368FR62_ANCCA|nr:UDP-glucoronosyl and UDP-glucosyl transferase [Ancylostoma caninum]